jgi:hypothetical protein
MNLTTIAQHLQAQNCGIIGRSIFVTEMPASCHSGILLLGSYGGTEIDAEMPDYYVTDFRAVFREKDMAAGLALAKLTSTALHLTTEIQVNDMLIRHMRPMNLPRHYRKSVGGYWEFEVDVFIVYNETNA